MPLLISSASPTANMLSINTEISISAFPYLLQISLSSGFTGPYDAPCLNIFSITIFFVSPNGVLINSNLASFIQLIKYFQVIVFIF